MTVNSIMHLLTQARRLLQPHSESPHLDAELLLAFALQQSRSYLFAWPDQIIPTAMVKQFYLYLARRCQREPLAYITNTKAFWSFTLTVTPHTLIPRPETELIIETALALMPAADSLQVADLGTGSGAIALALATERSHWQIHAVDQSVAALQVARQNAANLQLTNIHFYEGHWCMPLPHHAMNLIVSNPPYLTEAE